MRLGALVFGGLVLVAALAVQAALCPECKDRAYTKDIGVCTKCKDGVTTSGAFKLCMKCSSQLQQCQHCLKPLKGAATKPTTRPIDPKEDGDYTEGAWQYRYKVSGKGTRSEGYYGELLHSGKAVAAPESINDFHVTPWGPMYWVGESILQFGGHGWMPKPKVSAKPGKQLPEPAVAETKPAKS